MSVPTTWGASLAETARPVARIISESHGESKGTGRGSRYNVRVRIGAHVSIAGGLLRAFERADEQGLAALQIFTTNGSRWAPTVRAPAEVLAFAREARRRAVPILAHDSYLINLAAPAGEVRERSRAAFRAELERCEALGVGAVVMHPGAHLGEGVDEGMRRVGDHLREAIDATAGYAVRVLVELTAGQGTCLGSRFEELGAILDRVGRPERTGVCLDTCHAHAAGYDLVAAYDEVLGDLDRHVGLGEVRAFHLNDSKKPLGSRVDRHAEIGAGTIGETPFRRLVRDPRFAGVPAIVELPPAEAAASLARLTALARIRYDRKVS